MKRLMTRATLFALAALVLWACGGSKTAQAQCAGGACRPSYGGRYGLEVLTNGTPTASYWHGGRLYVEGCWGCRYTVRVSNHTAQRVEAVVSVDGLDVIDGDTANYQTKRGYLIQPYSSVDIDGWRVNHNEVSAFRFTSRGDSYAGRTGRPRNVGVIGAAFFPERAVVYTPPRPIMPRGAARGDDGRYGGAGEPQAADAAAPKAGPAPSAESGTALGGAYRRPETRQNMGTAWGEYRASDVIEVDFVRANRWQPAEVLSVYYDDRDGLIRKGVPVGCYGNCPPPPWPEAYPAVPRRFAEPPY